MARQYLGCPASSSATVERLFSVVGFAFSRNSARAPMPIRSRRSHLRNSMLSECGVCHNCVWCALGRSRAL
eukprot:scaffold213607_cov40-Tisochrysis_lutea.AAC.1